MCNYMYGSLPHSISDVFIFTYDIHLVKQDSCAIYVLLLVLLKVLQTVYSVKVRSSRMYFQHL